jgi:ATP-binding cassette subfamily B protein
MLKQEVPCQVHELLDRERLNGVPVLLSAASDLSVPGDLTKQWVIANRDHLAVVSGKAEPRVEMHLPIRRVEKFRARSTVGSGFLQAYVDDAWVDVARYSNRLAPQFQKIAEKLEDLRTTGQVSISADDELDADRCPKCGLKRTAAGAACPRCLPRKAIAARVWQLIRPQWRGALGICLLMMASVGLELVPPKLQQYLVDGILARGAAAPEIASLLSALLWVVTAVIITRLVLALVNWNKRLLANKVGVALTFDLRSQLVKKLHAQDLGYYDRHEVGSLASRVTHDSEILHSLLHQITGGFLLQFVQLIAIGVMLFTLNPKLALYTLIPAPLVFFGSIFFWKRVYPYYFRAWEASSKQAGALSGMLSGIRVVKAFAQEDRELERFSRSSDDLRRARVTVDRATASFSAVMGLVFSMGGLIVWYVGGRDVLGDQMTLGALMAFLAYLGMFYEPLSTLSEFTTWLTSVMAGCQRVFELLDASTATTEPARQRSLTQPRGEIAFDNVSFGYEANRPVLSDLSFAIPPGQRIGIVGKSGSGKSTLVNLISRFYDANSGRVLVDGIDVRDLSKNELRRHVGVVLQEPFLFRGTISDNLVYGQPSAGIDEAITAARAAQAHEFILRKPLAYDTWLGERGAGLSGGERQRVSIARALVYDPKILILDEATSSIDTESEQEIQEALRVLTRGRTTLAIAHRLSTLRDADRIFVLDKGRLAEEGTHNELMRLGGNYARLVKIQTQFARDQNFQAAVDTAVEAPDEATPDPVDDPSTADFAPVWLEPGMITLCQGRHGELNVEFPDGSVQRGVTALSCFPATQPESYISLRACDRDGHEQELGILRHLRHWPQECQTLVRYALGRNYFLHRITGIDAMHLSEELLTLKIRTDEGPAEFTMPWNESQVQDFGPHGKLLRDTDDNRYLLPDVNELQPNERMLFERYIYW